MNREQLVKALLDAGLPPSSFQVADAHELEQMVPDFWFLRAGADGGWEVGSYERGQYDVRDRFDSETDATAFMYKALTGKAAPA